MVFNHWFTADITTVFEKKFYCFDPLHGRLAMWLPSKNTQPGHVGGARRNGCFRRVIPPTNFMYMYLVQCNLKFQQKPCHIQTTSWPVSANISRTKSLASQSVSHQPVGQSVIQPVSQSVSQSVSQKVSQLVNQPVSQLVGQSVRQKVSQSSSQSVSQPVSQPASLLASQSVSLPASHSVNHQPVRQSVSQPVSQSVSLSVNKPVSQPASQLVSQ